MRMNLRNILDYALDQRVRRLKMLGKRILQCNEDSRYADSPYSVSPPQPAPVQQAQTAPRSIS